MQRLLDGDAGVVEGDVEAPIGADRLVDEGPDLVLDQDVGFDVEGLAAGSLDLVLDLLAEAGAAAAEGDLAAFGSEGQGRGASDAGGRAGDGDDLALETTTAGCGGTGADLGGKATATPAARPAMRPAAAPSVVEPRMRRRLDAGEAGSSDMAGSNLVVAKINYPLILTMTRLGLVS